MRTLSALLSFVERLYFFGIEKKYFLNMGTILFVSQAACSPYGEIFASKSLLSEVLL
jgi:hypothetical protein